ncbi:MAG: PKD domain-containing protein [Candidatus Thermoplasmatota archaeon]
MIILIFVFSLVSFPTCKAIDEDNDNLPDEWEHHYFGNLSQKPEDDYDHDGMNNFYECLADTNPTTPFSGGRVKAAWTYTYPFPGEMTHEKITTLMNNGINTFILNDYPVYVPYQNFSENETVYDLLGPDPNAPYIITYSLNGYPHSARITIKEKAVLAQQYGFCYIQTIAFNYAPFPNKNLIVPGTFPVVFSNGKTGSHVSPFSQAYWNHLTKMVKSLAYLSTYNPEIYRIDGVLFDFELYSITGGSYFDYTWGFENQTFISYLESRHLTPDPIPLPSERYSWLRAQGKIIENSDGSIQGDYYVFLSDLIKSYATTMREQVHAINPSFLIGAYPSPKYLSVKNPRLYLPEIFSGWSTPTHPAVVWATEMYDGGGAENIPENLSENLLDDGYYNLSSIFPSATSSNNDMYAYYVGGVLNSYYFSGNWGYHLYHLATQTNGYWIFTTYGFTEKLQNLTVGYIVPYFDRNNNTVYPSKYNSPYTPCNNQQTYEQGVHDYYTEMSLMNTELSKYFLNYPNYQTTLQKLSPPREPTIYVEHPEYMNPPTMKINPLESPEETMIELPEHKVRFRYQQSFLLYASENQTVKIHLLCYLFSKYFEVKAGITYAIYHLNGTELCYGVLSRPSDPLYSGYTGLSGNISFTAPYEGIFFLLINPSYSLFEITHTNVPFVVYKPFREPTIQEPLTDTDYIPIIDMYADSLNRAYSLYFWVHNLSSFRIDFKKTAKTQGFTASIYQPDKGDYTLVTSAETNITSYYLNLSITVPENARNTLWRLTVTKPLTQGQTFGNVLIRFSETIQPYFALTGERPFVLIQNRPPQTRNDEYIVNKDSTNNQLMILENDDDPEQDFFELQYITEPHHGIARISDNRQFVTYTPTAGYSGTDYFTYTVSDIYNNTNIAQVTITIRQQTVESEGFNGNPPPAQLPPPAVPPQNTAPYRPLRPAGPNYGEQNINYTFTTKAEDPDGDMIRYRFNWGNGIISSWSSLLPSNTSYSATYHWNSPGTYNISVQVQDEHGANSTWSDSFQFVVSAYVDDSQESNISRIPSFNSTVNQSVVFHATDYFPDREIVSCSWDFGDGTIAYGLQTTHRYTMSGTYTITLTISDIEGNTYIRKFTLTVHPEHYEAIRDQVSLLPKFDEIQYGGIIFISSISVFLIALYFYRRLYISRSFGILSPSKKIPCCSSSQNTQKEPNARQEIEQLLSLASQYSWNPKKAAEYYHLAKLKILEESRTLDASTLLRFQKTLSDIYNKI